MAVFVRPLMTPAVDCNGSAKANPIACTLSRGSNLSELPISSPFDVWNSLSFSTTYIFILINAMSRSGLQHTILAILGSSSDSTCTRMLIPISTTWYAVTNII